MGLNNSELPISKIVKSEPVFCCVKENNGMEVDIRVSCSIKFDYIICDSEKYTLGVGDASDAVIKSFLKSKADSELIIAFAKVGTEKVSYDVLKESGILIADMLKECFVSWKDLYGIEIIDISVSDIKASAEDEILINSMASKGMGTGASLPFTLPPQCAAVIDQVNHKNTADIIPNSEKIAPKLWICICGKESKGKFCPECGKKKPSEPSDGWKCSKCNTDNHGKFCTECGSAFPI